MFQNNIKIAIRTLLKNKIYTLVTFIGLTAGIAASLLIFRMLDYELGFNKSFTNSERIVRVVARTMTPTQGEVFGTCTPIPAMDVIEDKMTYFDRMSRVKEFWATLSIPDPNGGPPLKKFPMDPAQTSFFVESEFFDIFQLEWIVGDPKTAVSGPSSIVLTETWATKFFESPEAAMGQLLLMDNVVSVYVTGVVKDLPEQSDFPSPFFSSWETLKANQDDFFYSEEWGSCSSNNQIYGMLPENGKLDDANIALAQISKEMYDLQDRREGTTHLLQPLSDLHYDERFGHTGTHQISRSRLQILGVVGILILIMACFNFINLATAQATLRAREVGVRKTLGSSRGQLIAQFMTETGMIVICSIGFGVIIATLCLPFLSQISYITESIPFYSDPKAWVFLLGVGFFVTLLAGLYPSLVLAGFQPIQALKAQLPNQKHGGANLRKSLVVLQFVVAQALVIGAIITISQLDFIRSQDLGFSKDLVYTFGVNVDSSSLARQNALKYELLQIPSVEAVSFSSDQPLSGNTWSTNFRYASRPEDENYGLNLKFCDADYQKVYGINLLAGEWYQPSDTSRQGVVNMTLLKKLGIENPNEAVGQKINLGQSRDIEITGVAADFHTHSLHREFEPLLLTTRKSFQWEAGVKINAGDLSSSMASIQKAYDKIMPEQVFVGQFLDDRIDQFYEDEARLSATCKGFGLLAILISCLGLFGLAAHSAQQRVKEIGVRKVLGATTSGIVQLLSKDFLKLVILALFIAAIPAWFLMDKWLNNFEYRIDIQWWVFVITGILAILIAFMTISYQSFRAALANPIESLRNE